MPSNVDELYSAAMALPDIERAELAELIASSVESRALVLDHEWTVEIERRRAELDSGTVAAIPLAEALRHIESVLTRPDPRNG